MGRVVWITGASGGLGVAMAAAFAKGGDAVALGCFQNIEAAQKQARQLQSAGARTLVVVGDVADEAVVQRMHREVEQSLGPVQVLINNAGISGQRLFCDITVDEWQRMFDVHVKGAFLCSRAVLPYMIRERGGCVLNISSIWGMAGASCEVHYSAAKAALIGMTRALAKEVGPSGVRVNCLAPGAVDTAMMAGFTPEETTEFNAGVPLGRLASPEEIASAAVFLCSEGASYITGQVLAANGGMF